ncbi:MAG: MotA/TolQ/ExbB proton channel family protein, partial [Ignavibacteriales bacterium]|nr:MotA/TolQ/ExbB proton channel family protein [Ignavibacteriales bacterium]
MIVVELFLRGGIAMWVVLFCLIVVLMVGVERISSLRRSQFDGKQLLLKLRNLLNRNDVVAAADACTYSGFPVARIFKKTLSRFSAGRAEMRAAASLALEEERVKMRQAVEVLATMAVAAPLLGVLGTLINLYVALQTVERLGGTMTVVFLAAEVREAMMVGIFGCSVGFLAFSAYQYCKGKTNERLLQCEQQTEELLETDFAPQTAVPADEPAKPVAEKLEPVQEQRRPGKTVFSDA